MQTLILILTLISNLKSKTVCVWQVSEENQAQIRKLHNEIKAAKQARFDRNFNCNCNCNPFNPHHRMKDNRLARKLEKEIERLKLIIEEREVHACL